MEDSKEVENPGEVEQEPDPALTLLREQVFRNGMVCERFITYLGILMCDLRHFQTTLS
jgi:hypothetical protein